MPLKNKRLILWFEEIDKNDISLVGGKNASLGEMFSHLKNKGVNIPDGFALTAEAYRYYLRFNNLEEKIKKIVQSLNAFNIRDLQQSGKLLRNLMVQGDFPPDLKKEILKSYHLLCQKYQKKNISLAVRSSATFEDLPTASFAGQHETYLNVSGEKQLLQAIKKCLASVFTDRAIAYREEKGFDHLKIALSVGVQKMVRSDLASSGIMFTLDTETGFKNVVLINAIFGAGEMIVQGKITPDEFYVFKPTLKQNYPAIISKSLGKKNKKYIYNKKGGLKEVSVSLKDQKRFSLKDEEILTLAKWACLIEDHYQKAQDIEWAKDGETKELFIVQSRPETVHQIKEDKVYEEYQLKVKAKPILRGIAIGNKISQGTVRIIEDISKASEFKKGEILVTKMTDPDWVPLMRIAAGIVTDEGGKTCHAAIIGRELGVPVIVGVGRATQVLKNGQKITIDCTASEGKIYSGLIPYQIKRYNLEKIPQLKTKVMINIGAPEIAFKTSFLPNEGVGLARLEFVLAEKIRIHPLALYFYQNLKKKKDPTIKKIIKQIDQLTEEHQDKREYFIKELAEGIALIAAAFYPKPTIIRLSDLKSNEYRALIGGELFEPEESNPMIGWRGASRYYDEKFKPAFKMECLALKRARDILGLKNIWIMVPFCRTPEEGQKVIDLLKENGLERGKNDLKIIVMCEIPSNVILIEKFLEIFDGVSIGSNDLTQLVLGLDRDSSLVAKIADERNEAVKEMIKKVIKTCRQKNKYCGICGQAPSDYLEFARFLTKEGIESISLNPDSVVKTILNLAKIN